MSKKPTLRNEVSLKKRDIPEIFEDGIIASTETGEIFPMVKALQENTRLQSNVEIINIGQVYQWAIEYRDEKRAG